jgi:ABC-type branched-subunit amino acid transport system substrate-binding protein
MEDREMKKTLIMCTVVLLMLTVFMTACTKSKSSSSQNLAPGAATIKIGVAVPETGPNAAFMVWFKTGIIAAADTINVAGGINGKQVEIVYGDTGSGDIATCLQRLTELKEAGCVAIIAQTESGGMQWAQENKMPVVILSNTSTDETIVNYNDYAFFSGLNAWGLSKMLVAETVGKQKFNDFVFVGVDEACTIDAENLLIYEGKKLNPNFHIISSYRMGWDDDKFATIVSTIMSLPKQPDMILQQGGGPNFVSFAQQSSLYGLFDQCDIYNDLTTDTSTAATLVEAGTFPYGETHGISLLQWWDKSNPEIQEFVDVYHKASLKLGRTELEPSDSGYTCYLGAISILKAADYCIANGTDYTKGDELANAMMKISWKSFSGEHRYRDFDHVLTYDAYYVTSADGGAEFGHYPIGTDVVKFTSDEYLPALEDMKVYAAQLGYPNRFK